MKKKSIFKKNYKTFLKVWKRAEAGIDGQPIIAKYLYRYCTEKADKYKYRKKVSSYNNLPDTILQRWQQILCNANIAVTAKGSMEEVLKNLDRKGSDIKEFSKELFAELAIYGSVWMLVDLPIWNNKPESPDENQRIAARIFPYLSIYTQPNVIDWNYHDDGSLRSITVRTNKVIEDTNEEYCVYAKYVLGLKQEFYVIGDEKKLVGKPIKIEWNNKPVLPWVSGGVQRYRTCPDYYKGQMNAIIDTAIELYNRSSANGSNYDKIGFAFLAVGDQTDISELGNQSVVTVGKDDDMPEYIQPDATCFEQYRKEIERLIENIFTLAGVKNRSVVGETAKSGTAMKMEDSVAQNMVQLIADKISDIMKKAVEVLKIANGTPNEEVEVIFPESYDVDALETELKVLEEIWKLKNNAFYLQSLNNFVKRKVKSPEKQKEIINEAEKSIGLRLNTLPSNDILKTLIDGGIVGLNDLAMEVNPDIKDKPEEALKWITANLEILQKAKEKYSWLNSETKE